MVTTPQTWWSCRNTVERVRYKLGAFFEVETSFSLHFCKWGTNFEVQFKKKNMYGNHPKKIWWSSGNTVERVKQKWIAFFEVETLFFCYCCCYYYCYCTVYFLGGVVALLLKTTKRERKKERKSAKRTKKRTKNGTKTCRFFVLFLVPFFWLFREAGEL